MFDLFADIFTYRQNALVKADPRVKLIASLWAIMLALLAGSALFPAALFLFSMIMLASLRVPAKVIAGRLLIPVSLVMVILVLKLFMTEGEPLFSTSWLDMPFEASREGLYQGILIGARTMGACSLILLLGVTTPAHDVFRALLWMKAPREWVEVAMLMYRYIFVLIETAINMATAQKLRLGYSGFRQSLRSMGTLSGMVILRSADQALKTGEAMLLRGSGGSLPVGQLKPLTLSHLRVLFPLCAAAGAAFGVFEWMLN